MNRDVLKGILIILVIIDHNEYSRKLFPALLAGLSFHVVGFMTIPFLRPAMRFWSRDFGQYLFRLYYPFALLTCAMALLVMSIDHLPAGQHLRDTAVVLYSGNSDALKHVTQMGLLWFLPSFISLLILRTAIEGLGTAGKIASLGLIAAAHPFLGLVPAAAWNYLPLGILPALYVLPLAYGGAWLHQRVLAPARASSAVLASGLVFLIVKVLQVRLGLSNEVGFLQVADYRDPLALMINDLEAVSGTLMLFQLARCLDLGLLAQAGRFSMQIYLIHAFIALALFKAALRVFPAGSYVPAFAATAGLTVLLSIGAARLLVSNRWTRRLIFPKSSLELIAGPGTRPAA